MGLPKRQELPRLPETPRHASGLALDARDPLETVSGVALEPGERVLLFARPNHTTARILHIAVGIVLLPLLVGIAVLVYGIFYERWHLRFVALTDRRIVTRVGEKGPRWLYLKDVVDLRAKRAARGGAKVIGAASAVPSVSTDPARLKVDPKFWAHADTIVVQGKKGALAIDDSVPPETLGPAIANAVYTPGYLDRQPTADYPR